MDVAYKEYPRTIVSQIFFFSWAVIMFVAMIVIDRTIQRPKAHYFGHLRKGGPRKLSVPMFRWFLALSDF